MTIEDHLRDIRELEPSDMRSDEISNARVLFEGRLPEQLIHGLERLFKHVEDRTYMILETVPSDSDGLEGRGVYQLVDFEGRKVVFYSKGSGSVKALSQNPRPLGAFGPVDGKLFFDDVDNHGHYPRVWGAQSAEWANYELLNGARIFYGLATGFGFETIESCIEAGLSIPVNSVAFRFLTRQLAEDSIKAISAGHTWAGFVVQGASGEIVPSTMRTERYFMVTEPELFKDHDANLFGQLRKSQTFIRRAGNAGGPATFETIGRTLRNLVQQAYIITSPASLHNQNFYLAPHSVCAQADNSDMMPLEYLSRPEQHLTIYNALVALSPFIGSGEFGPIRDDLAGFLTGVLGDAAKAWELSGLMPVFGVEILIAAADYLLDTLDSQHAEKVVAVYGQMAESLDGKTSLEGIRKLTPERHTGTLGHMSLSPLYICKKDEKALAAMRMEDVLGCKRNGYTHDFLGYMLHGSPLKAPEYRDAQRLTDMVIHAGKAESYLLTSRISEIFWGLKTDLMGELLETICGMVGSYDFDGAKWLASSVMCANHDLAGENAMADERFKTGMREVLRTQPAEAAELFYALSFLDETLPEHKARVYETYLNLMENPDPAYISSWVDGLKARGVIAPHKPMNRNNP